MDGPTTISTNAGYVRSDDNGPNVLRTKARHLGIDVHEIESGAVVLMMIVLIALGAHTYFVTLPAIDTEVKVTQYASLTAEQNMAITREILDRERTQLPITQGKLNTALDDTHTLLTTTNKLIGKLSKNQDSISKQTIATLKDLSDGLGKTAGAFDAVGKQTVESEKAVTGTVNLIGDTAKEATMTAYAITGTVQETTSLIKDAHGPIVETVKSTKSAAGNVSDMTKEGKDWVHHVIHPSWPKRVYGEVKDWTCRIVGNWL